MYIKKIRFGESAHVRKVGTEKRSLGAPLSFAGALAPVALRWIRLWLSVCIYPTFTSSLLANITNRAPDLVRCGWMSGERCSFLAFSAGTSAADVSSVSELHLLRRRSVLTNFFAVIG